jgi:hypothetical protein
MLTTTATLGDQFARSLLAKDWDRVAAILAPDVHFRGLTPGRYWEANSATEVVEGILKQWFEPSDEIYEVLSVANDRVVDRQRVVYRARIRNPDGDFVCEQTAYYDTEGERITKVRVLCSGFVPAAGRAGT